MVIKEVYIDLLIRKYFPYTICWSSELLFQLRVEQRDNVFFLSYTIRFHSENKRYNFYFLDFFFNLCSVNLNF
ncbi:Uncharacterised protein [Sphingobacterium spiritivorum]|uniref:Uncharacterized protein n=1 Tax=Sphingobacterium spiritivorum TaxID=258 RepID=A0A380CUT8_SPHSI|nr:Uncharacterised protein [Sphingobacterium spiritivorum]